MTKEREFDVTYNEGGEGYNPYRAAREAAETKLDAASPVTCDDLYRQLERFDNSSARESSTYDAARCDAIRAQITAIKAVEADAFAAIWTLETTKARRIEWNDFARANSTAKGMHFAVAADKMRQLGWDTTALKAAIKLHNL